MLSKKYTDMKDRIQELMVQAGTDVSGKWMSLEQAEKFAKLIVRECINSVSVWEKDSRNHISYMLRNHFDLEENR